MKQRMPLLWFALPFALLTAVSVTGCQKDAAEEAEAASTDAATPPADTMPAETVATAPTETPPAGDMTKAPAEMPAPVPGTDAVVVENKATPIDAAPSFDAKAFAGRYASGATVLEVTADGMFSLDDNGTAIAGSWTLMPGGKMIILDPDSKSEADRRIEVASADSVKLVGSNTTLRRDKTTP